ncbi:MAG: phosphotransferase family protein [Acidimicrobiia bacterium]|nr:phosphotransferase family protein [Acidimicrobiia bacterium]
MPSRTERVAAALGPATEAHLGAGDVSGLRRLSGGASRETWSFDWVHADGESTPLVLRRDPTSTPLGMDREAEYRLLEAAHGAGVAVPRVVFCLGEDDGLGSGFVMERIEGETIPRKILRDPEYADARPRLAHQCGEQLARIHSIDPDGLPGLGTPREGDHPAAALLAQYEMILDSIGEPHPAFELGLRRLRTDMPDCSELRLVHGDFRNGNLVVGTDGLRAVLDWELAHVGDPIEDLGWLCVRSWRFGNDDLRVGGFGDLDTLLSAYVSAGGRQVDPEAVRWWEIFGNVKWGVICLVQSRTHLGGAHRSVELAALGRRACEMEYDLLTLLA